MIAFAARDFSSVKSAADGDFNALDARLGNFLYLLFYSSSVRNALFKLGSNRFRNELCVLVDFFNLSDVDYYRLAFRKLRKVFLDYFDFRAGLADKYAGATRVNADFDLVRSTNDCDFAYRRIIVLFLYKGADFVIFFEICAERFFVGIPLSVPGLDNSDS